jgi:streptogramin lyase
MRRSRFFWEGAGKNFLAAVIIGAASLTTGTNASRAATSPADVQAKKVALGGPHGVVRNSKGFPIEGMMVQLISKKSSIRTTVYTNVLGAYEFPKLESGAYTLRTPRALEYRTFAKEDVPISGAAKLDDIVMERVTEGEFLPPTPEILAQMTDGEWLYNIPGTGQEKRIFSNYCGAGCHTYQMQMRSRFDERSWRLIVHRMTDYGGRILVGPPGRNPVPPEEQAEREIMIKWLARVRGPDAQNPPMKVFPRPHGAATRAIVTEYELPWVGVHVHDVYPDPQGNIWFTINRSPFIGKLDPKTGQVVSYRTPGTPDKHPGGHWLQVEPSGKVWYSETWAQNLIEFDPKTEKFRLMHTGLQGNMALSPKDGTLWRTADNKLNRYDRETGKPVESFEMKNIRETYGNWISWDARYVSGGNRDRKFDGIFFFDRQTKELKEIPSPSGSAAESRGSFDPDGNSWAGGRGGVLLKYDRKLGVATEYAPPTPYQTFYETRADKNGEVWAGEMRGGRIARFNPRNEQWTEYVLPEPFSFDWQTYVDNSTDPVNIWYGDQYGYIVHIQPLE